ncbi:MAG: hypothetical protein Q9224_007363, partial [Gallowayella concinna]
MTLQDTSILAIAEIGFYFPALLLSIIIVIRHGFNRELGWIFLCILALIRLIGNAEEIAANQNHSNGLFIAAAVCNGLGLGPLLLVTIGMLKRVNTAALENQAHGRRAGLLQQGNTTKFLNWGRLPLLVALVLGAVGSAKLYGSDESEHSQGGTLAR